jgi:hypothetical protein
MPSGSIGTGKRPNQRERKCARRTVPLSEFHNPPQLSKDFFTYRSHCISHCGTRDCGIHCEFEQEIAEFICKFYFRDRTGVIVEHWRQTIDIRLETEDYRLLWQSPAYHTTTEEGTTCLNPTLSDQYLTRLENTTPPQVPFIIRRATETGPNPEVQHTAEGEPIPVVVDHRRLSSPPPRQRVEPGHPSLYRTQTLVGSLSLTEIDAYLIGGNVHLTSSSEESVVTQTDPEEHIPRSGLTPALQTALARRVVEDNTSDRYHRISITPNEQDWPAQDQATWEGHLPSTPSPHYSRASS